MQREATAMTVRQNLGELLNEVRYQQNEIVITRAGKPVAALISIQAYAEIQRIRDADVGKLMIEMPARFEGLSPQIAHKLAEQLVNERYRGQEKNLPPDN